MVILLFPAVFFLQVCLYPSPSSVIPSGLVYILLLRAVFFLQKKVMPKNVKQKILVFTFYKSPQTNVKVPALRSRSLKIIRNELIMSLSHAVQLKVSDSIIRQIKKERNLIFTER